MTFSRAIKQRDKLTYVKGVYDIAWERVIVDMEKITLSSVGVKSKRSDEISYKENHLCQAQAELHDACEQKESEEDLVR